MGVGDKPKDGTRPENNAYNSDYSSEYIRVHDTDTHLLPEIVEVPSVTFATPDNKTRPNVQRAATSFFRPHPPLEKSDEPSQPPGEDPVGPETCPEQTSSTPLTGEIPSATQLFPDEAPQAEGGPEKNQLEVPPASQPTPSNTSAASRPGPSRRHRISDLKVLVVDDDDITRRLMSRMLTRLGCVVDTAENGSIAAEKVLGAPFDIKQNDPLNPYPLQWRRAIPSLQVTSTSAGERIYDIVFLDNQMVRFLRVVLSIYCLLK